jgi:hypothetical protein
VRSIVNELGVMGNSTLTQRSSDSLTTGRVKASMVDAKDMFANSFKVVTERGTTYLMGRVTQREANRATDIARSTSGVQRSCAVLEIITEEELQRTLPQEPAKPKQPGPRSPERRQARRPAWGLFQQALDQAGRVPALPPPICCTSP